MLEKVEIPAAGLRFILMLGKHSKQMCQTLYDWWEKSGLLFWCIIISMFFCLFFFLMTFSASEELLFLSSILIYSLTPLAAWRSCCCVLPAYEVAPLHKFPSHSELNSHKTKTRPAVSPRCGELTLADENGSDLINSLAACWFDAASWWVFSLRSHSSLSLSPSSVLTSAVIWMGEVLTSCSRSSWKHAVIVSHVFHFSIFNPAMQ